MQGSMAVPPPIGYIDGKRLSTKNIKDKEASKTHKDPKIYIAFISKGITKKCREETTIVKPVGISNTQFIVMYLQKRTG